MIMQNDLSTFDFNTPLKCEMCGHVKLIYDGIGEYRCEQCGYLMYDDYGVVRNYLEKNPGATQGEVSKATGIPTSVIRRLLKEDKIQIAPGSIVFLHCEMCGADIRSGRLCDRCSRGISVGDATKKNSTEFRHVVGGFVRDKKEATGSKRFTRDN